MLVMKNVPWRETGWAVAFVVLLIGMYAGAYLALVKRDLGVMPMSSSPLVELGEVEAVPRYVGGDVFACLFAPAHAVDRQLRPFYWSWDGYFQYLTYGR